MQLALLIIIILLAMVIAMGVLILFGLRNINARLDELGTLTPPQGSSAPIPTFKAISNNRDSSSAATLVAAKTPQSQQSHALPKEEVPNQQVKSDHSSQTATGGLVPAQPFHKPPDENAPLTIPCPNCSYIHVIADWHTQRRYVCPECQTPIEIEED